MDEAAVAVAGDAGQGAGEELFGGAELFVALRQDVVGDQDGSQVSGDSRAWVGVECLVGRFHSAGGHLDQQGRAGAVA
ncbi:hypothetical protein NIIDMKKI_57320 [Mycobacterium kansasii]|uniref:Uncharacterized protein n=1 Tax=Mycobacterium kansasii TaxID=1768 RepID=A0A7G1IHN1_MYCKA|nr:hypothetical protein NIIDMKKI_57320 [Mycobacterium kansasii]